MCCTCKSIYMHTWILDVHIYRHKYIQNLHKALMYCIFFNLCALQFNNLV